MLLKYGPESNETSLSMHKSNIIIVIIAAALSLGHLCTLPSTGGA